jgi:hypothetical protein
MSKKMTARDFIEGFGKNTLGKRKSNGNWSVRENMGVRLLTFHGQSGTATIAFRLPDGTVVSNANRLGVGQACYNHNSPWYPENGRSRCQVWLEESGATPLPFSLFREAKLEVTDFKWVVQPPTGGETVNRKRQTGTDKKGEPVFETKPEHFVGACLFKVGQHFFLFDVDRQELEHDIFNPFVVELPIPAYTIEEAYEALVPDEVKQAVKAKKKVFRQGEYYFVSVGKEQPNKLKLTKKERDILRYPPNRAGFLMQKREYNEYFRGMISQIPSPQTEAEKEFNEAVEKYNTLYKKFENSFVGKLSLETEGFGSHFAEKGTKVGDKMYVSGKVEHRRREHGDIRLDGWYLVVRNAAKRSVTIRGEVD